MTHTDANTEYEYWHGHIPVTSHGIDVAVQRSLSLMYHELVEWTPTIRSMRDRLFTHSEQPGVMARADQLQDLCKEVAVLRKKLAKAVYQV